MELSSSMVMRDESNSLCMGLAQLKGEHTGLRAMMEAYRQPAEEIASAAGGNDFADAMKDIVEKVKNFHSELEAHSQREEQVLFPLMAHYIGREMGPIAVMEYEHELARSELAKFLALTETGSAQLTQEEAVRLLQPALEAYNTLQSHFLKEENILFPMAEELLSQAEKEELAARISMM